MPDIPASDTASQAERAAASSPAAYGSLHWMNIYPVGALLGALAILSAVFLMTPGLDLAVSRAFTDPASRFFLAHSVALGALRDLGNGLTLGVAALAVAGLLAPIVSPLRRFIFRPHECAYVLAVYAIGPGLIVNAIMKNVFGRARPRSIVEFGGALHFSPVWSVDGGCLHNCSFVSGEGAAAAALLCLVFVAPPAYRLLCGLTLFVLAALISINRIASGGHFLSDVLLSWVIVLLVAVAMRPLFFGERGVAIDGWFRRIRKP